MLGIQQKRKQTQMSVFLELTFQDAGGRQVTNTISQNNVCTGVDAVEKNWAEKMADSIREARMGPLIEGLSHEIWRKHPSRCKVPEDIVSLGIRGKARRDIVSKLDLSMVTIA